MTQSSVAGFQDVDRTGDPSELLRHLQRTSETEEVVRIGQERLARFGIPRRGIVADLGCGLGGQTIMLARHVSPGSGRAIGVDMSKAMLSFARARPDAEGLPIEFREADVHRLPFEDESLDAVWIERVLIHVEDPRRVLRELWRVLRPGGRASFAETAHHGTTFDSPDREVSDLIAATNRASLRNPDVGPALPRLLREAGFAGSELYPELFRLKGFEMAAVGFRWREILARFVEEGRITEERAGAWLEGMRTADAAGIMVCLTPVFVAFATK
jgi:ubiquinone/menaquinone biosynthesis C-methylase UbiE